LRSSTSVADSAITTSEEEEDDDDEDEAEEMEERLRCFFLCECRFLTSKNDWISAENLSKIPADNPKVSHCVL
jgi:hypothetical protein